MIDAPHMSGPMYERPSYPNTWARKEGNGRVWYTALGHREDVWTNPTFQQILGGGIKWALGEVSADVTPNLKTAALGAYTNPRYAELAKIIADQNKAKTPALNTLTAQEKTDGWKLLWDEKNHRWLARCEVRRFSGAKLAHCRRRVDGGSRSASKQPNG